jgi:hypothetical protein
MPRMHADFSKGVSMSIADPTRQQQARTSPPTTAPDAWARRGPETTNAPARAEALTTDRDQRSITKKVTLSMTHREPESQSKSPASTQARTTAPEPVPHPCPAPATRQAARRGKARGPRGPGSGPPLCPTCGRPAFSLVASIALDAILIAQEALDDAKAILEEGVLP